MSFPLTLILKFIIAFKDIKILPFEKNHLSNLLPFLKGKDEHSVHDLISVKNINAYCEFLKWCAISTVAQKDFRRIEHDGVDKCLTIYDEALAIFVFMDKYKYWRAIQKEAATQPSCTDDEADESGEDNSDTSEFHTERVLPRFTTGTSKAWSDEAVKFFNELCGSISSQQKLGEYSEVLRMVKRQWFTIDDGGNCRKRRAVELMRLQLENRLASDCGGLNDKVFSEEVIRKNVR